MKTTKTQPTGSLRRMVRILPAAPLEIERLINALPPDVNKKLSLHDLKRIADAYNTGPCPNCYGGFQRPCQWCGDTGVVTLYPNAEVSDGGPLTHDKPAAQSRRSLH